MSNKIAAIKLVKAAAPNLGLKDAKDLVEAIIPLVQFSQIEIKQRIESLEYSIATFQTYSSISEDSVKHLLTLVQERDNYMKLICTKFHEGDAQ